MKHVDLLVIGGGPGGYVAALRAAQLGGRVALVEQDSLGGTCLNYGCIPTKALYKSAELFSEVEHLEEFGIQAENVSLDYSQVIKRKDDIVSQLVEGVEGLLNNLGVEVISGTCEVKSSNSVAVNRQSGEQLEVRPDKIIIATGSQAIRPPIPGSDLDFVYTSDEFLSKHNLPKRITIVGGGVIGVEFASILAKYGVEVNLVEKLPRILPMVDSEIVRRFNSYLKRSGVNVLNKSEVLEIFTDEQGQGNVKVMRKDSEQVLPSDSVILSVGRKATLTGINAETIGLETSEEGIVVNEKTETNIPGIYAIGDVSSKGAMLAHVASHQGKIAAENALGTYEVFENKAIPNCIFSLPEISSVGMTEDECQEEGIPVSVGKFSFGGNGKAVIQGKPDGIVKIVSQKYTQKVLGVHIIGQHASDLIQEGTLAVKEENRVDELVDLVHPHPTLSESVWEAALDIMGTPIHQVKKKKSK